MSTAQEDRAKLRSGRLTLYSQMVGRNFTYMYGTWYRDPMCSGETCYRYSPPPISTGLHTSPRLAHLPCEGMGWMVPCDVHQTAPRKAYRVHKVVTGCSGSSEGILL